MGPANRGGQLRLPIWPAYDPGGLVHEHANHHQHARDPSHGPHGDHGAAHGGSARPPLSCEASQHTGHDNHTAHDNHSGHSVAIFGDKFCISLLLMVPTVIWSGMIQHWFGYSAPRFPGSAYVPALFGTAVYFYGGSPFLAGAYRELRDRLPGMMTLISLAITVAFVYSLLVTLGG